MAEKLPDNGFQDIGGSLMAIGVDKLAHKCSSKKIGK